MGQKLLAKLVDKTLYSAGSYGSNGARAGRRLPPRLQVTPGLRQTLSTMRIFLDGDELL